MEYLSSQEINGITVTNVGSRPGDELVQLYLTEVEATVRVPTRSLQGIQRIHPAPARDAS